MADEEDETFPPETQKLPTEFAFREFGRLLLTTNEIESISHVRNSLLAVANTYGLVFVGYPTGFKVYNTKNLLSASSSEGNPVPVVQADVSLRCPPHWLAVSSDNLTLVICSTSDKGLQALFFDIRNIINKAKPTKTPFRAYSISKSSKDTVSSLHWNPSVENTKYLAICVSSGAFHMLSVSDDVQEVGCKLPDFGACSACWSPRGKQVMIGKKDGSMQQYTPNLEIRRTIPVYDAVERAVRVDDVLWLSTLQVAFSYTPISESGDWQPSLFIVTLPPAKEQQKAPSFRNYEDPCYGVTGPRPSHFMMSYVDKWNLFVISSADASETAVIAKNKSNELWEIWNLDDSCRAQLPMEDSNEEPYPLGVALLYTAEDRIVIDDTRECGPMPVFAMLSCDGYISLFHMINLQSEDEYPNLVFKPQVLSCSNERPAVVNKSGSSSLKKASLEAVTQIQPSKPTSDISSVAPPIKPLTDSSATNTPKLSTAPLHGGGTGTGGNALCEKTIGLGTGKLQPRSLTFQDQSTPVVTNNVRAAQEQTSIESANKSSVNESKPVFKIPLSKTFSLAPSKSEGQVLPPPTAPMQSQIKLILDPIPPISLDSSISSLSGTSNQINSARSSGGIARSIPTTIKRKTSSKPEEDKIAEPAISSQTSNSVLYSLGIEVNEFEAELQAFFDESANLKKVVGTLGSDDEKVSMHKELETMTDFSKEITKTTLEQYEEVKVVRGLTLESYAAVQNTETYRKRVANPAYRSALYARPLDLSDQRKMKDIRSFYHHIKSSIAEVHRILDDQWDHFMKQKKSSSLHKSKRRLEIEERETVRQAILNQTQILHNQEMNLLLLGQQLDKLRLLNTSWQTAYIDQSFRKAYEKPTIDVNDDLSTLASSLIHQDAGDADKNIKSPETTRHSHVSPKKAHQLSEYLSSRRSAEIRSSYGRRSKFIAPSFVTTQAPVERKASKESGSRSRVSSTSKSEYSEESEDNSESEEVTESTTKTPGYYSSSVGAHTQSAQSDPNFNSVENFVSRSASGKYLYFDPSASKPSTSQTSSTHPTHLQASTSAGRQEMDAPPEGTISLAAFNTTKPNTTSISSDAIKNKLSNVSSKPNNAVAQDTYTQGFESTSMPNVTGLSQISNQASVIHYQQHSIDSVGGDLQKFSQPPGIRKDGSNFAEASVSDLKPPSDENAEKLRQKPVTASAPFSQTSSSKSTVTGSNVFGSLQATFSSMVSAPNVSSTITNGSQLHETNSSRIVGSSTSTSGGLVSASLQTFTAVDSHQDVKAVAPALIKISTATSSEESIPATAATSITDVTPSATQSLTSFAQSTSRAPPMSGPGGLLLQVLTANNPEGSSSAEPAISTSEGLYLKAQSTSGSSGQQSIIPEGSIFGGKPANPSERSFGNFSISQNEVQSTIAPNTTSFSAPTANSDPLFTRPSTNAPANSLIETPTTATGTSLYGLRTSTTTGTVFGAPTITSAGDSLFGASTTTVTTERSLLGLATNSTSRGSLFESPSSNVSGGLFAAPATTSSGSSLFSASLTTSSVVSSFSNPVTTIAGGSLFGAPSITSSGGSFFGAPSTTSSVASLFGAPSTTSSGGLLFGAPLTTSSGGSLFGAPLTTSSGGSLFGAPLPTGSGGLLFGAPLTTSSGGSLFGTTLDGVSSIGKSSFGAPPTFGSVAASVPSTFSTSSNAFGGGSFLSGLGSTPNQSSNANPFAAASSSTTSSENKSLFGNTASSPFSSGFGKPAATGTGFGSAPDSSFGSLNKPTQAGFGGPAVFGSPPSFGSQPVFGAAPQFGSSSFGSASTFGSAPTFGNQTGSTFGSSGFGAFTNSNSTGFGALAGQSNTSGGFGALVGHSGSGGFGALTSPSGSSGGFGSLAGQSASSGGFGALAGQSNSSGGFGALAGQNASGGFGALAGQSSSTVGFGAMSNQQQPGFGGGFNAAKPAKPSFTGWR